MQKKLLLTSIGLTGIEYLLPDIKGKKVLFVPTGADTYGDKWFIEADREEITKRGCSVKDLDIKGKTKEKLYHAVKGADMLFIAGGNAFYLLEKVRETGFDEVIKDTVQQGKVYVGASAGAVLACLTIEPIKHIDDPTKAPNLKDYKGLGLVDFVVLPHYGKAKYMDSYKNMIDEYGKKFKLIPITDDQAIVVDGSNYRVVSKK